MGRLVLLLDVSYLFAADVALCFFVELFTDLDAEFDDSFNATAKRNAEAILESKNAIFQSTLYAQAVHGFAVRANLSIPAQKFAKDASYLQAVTWFDAWL